MTQPQMSVPPQYNLSQLQDYITITQHITGKKMTEIPVSQDFFNWFREQRKRAIISFGVKDFDKSDSAQEFMGLRVVPIIEVKK